MKQELIYTLTRKAVKNINIRIKKSGEIVVSAPYFCTKKRIDQVLIEKLPWILEKQKQITSLPNINFTEYDKSDLSKRLELLVPKWENITGIKCSSWSIRNMKTRWGSCNTRTHKINFSTMLADKSDECIESVVIHELAHIKVPNHSSDFYNFIYKYMPDYKIRNNELKRRNL